MDDAPVFTPVELTPDADFVALGCVAEFDATFDSDFESHPFALTMLPITVTAEGDPAACVLVGVALDGTTTHAPGAGGAVLQVRPGVPTRTTFHFTRHPVTAARPRFWPDDPARPWPGAPAAGHLVPGPHRATLWARVVGGSARVVAATLNAVPRPR